MIHKRERKGGGGGVRDHRKSLDQPRSQGGREGKTHHLKSLDQPRAQGFFLRKWEERERALGTKAELGPVD